MLNTYNVKPKNAPPGASFSRSMDKIFRIILTDDDEQDQEFFRDALQETDIDAELYTARDGHTLLDLLTTFKTKNTPSPDLIFLDLNMPVMDGRETLKLLKSSPDFGTIPVIIYSTSNSIIDVNECYRNGANLFITKPCDFNQIVTIIKTTHTLFKSFAIPPAKNILQTT